MGLEKCPRCELNYIRDGEKYCTVCRREMHGEEEKIEVEVCSACGERRPVQGEELCIFCLREIHRQEGIANEEEAAEESPINPLAVTEMDEIDIDVEEDEEIPSSELGEIDRELGGDDEEITESLEQLEEEELNQSDEDEEDI